MTHRSVAQTDFETSMQALGFSHRQEAFALQNPGNLLAAAAAVHIQYMQVRQKKTHFIKPAPSSGEHTLCYPVAAAVHIQYMHERQQKADSKHA